MAKFPLSITRLYVQQSCIPNMLLLKLLQHRSLPLAFKCSDYVGKFSFLTHIQTTKICTLHIFLLNKDTRSEARKASRTGLDE
jgi:hypothetical protein